MIGRSLGEMSSRYFQIMLSLIFFLKYVGLHFLVIARVEQPMKANCPNVRYISDTVLQ